MSSYLIRAARTVSGQQLDKVAGGQEVRKMETIVVTAKRLPPEQKVVKMETIVVTAQRRSENLQQVPLSVTAITADALAKNDIRDLSRVDILLIDLRIPDMRGDAIFEYAAGVQTHLREHTLFITGDISDAAQPRLRAVRH